MKNRLKSLISLLLCVAMLLSFCACGAQGSQTTVTETDIAVLSTDTESVIDKTETLTLTISTGGAILSSALSADDVLLGEDFVNYTVVDVKRNTDTSLTVSMKYDPGDSLVNYGNGTVGLNNSAFELGGNDSFSCDTLNVKMIDPGLYPVVSRTSFENGVLTIPMQAEGCTFTDAFGKDAVTLDCADENASVADIRVDESGDVILTLNIDVQGGLNEAIAAANECYILIDASAVEANEELYISLYQSFAYMIANMDYFDASENSTKVSVNVITVFGTFAEDLDETSFSFSGDFANPEDVEVTRKTDGVVTIDFTVNRLLSEDSLDASVTAASGTVLNQWGTNADEISCVIMTNAISGRDDGDSILEDVSSFGDEVDDFVMGNLKEHLQQAAQTLPQRLEESMNLIYDKASDKFVAEFTSTCKNITSFFASVNATITLTTTILQWTGVLQSQSSKLDKIYDKLLDMEKTISKMQQTMDQVASQVYSVSQNINLNNYASVWTAYYNQLVELGNQIETYNSLYSSNLYNIMQNGSIDICYAIIYKDDLANLLGSDATTEELNTTIKFLESWRPAGIANLGDNQYAIPALRKDNQSTKSYDGQNLAKDSQGNVYVDTFEFGRIKNKDGKTIYGEMQDAIRAGNNAAYENVLSDIAFGLVEWIATNDAYKDDPATAVFLSHILLSQIEGQAGMRTAWNTEFDSIITSYKNLCQMTVREYSNPIQAFHNYIGCFFNFSSQTENIRKSMATYEKSILKMGYGIVQGIGSYRNGQYSDKADIGPLYTKAVEYIDDNPGDHKTDGSQGRNDMDWQYSYIKKGFIQLNVIQPIKSNVTVRKATNFSTNPIMTDALTAYTAYVNNKFKIMIFSYQNAFGQTCTTGSGSGSEWSDFQGRRVSSSDDRLYNACFSQDEMKDFYARCTKRGKTIAEELKSAGYNQVNIDRAEYMDSGIGSVSFKKYEDEDIFAYTISHGSFQSCPDGIYTLLEGYDEKGYSLIYDSAGISWDYLIDVNLKTYQMTDISSDVKTIRMVTGCFLHKTFTQNIWAFMPQTDKKVAYFTY